MHQSLSVLFTGHGRPVTTDIFSLLLSPSICIGVLTKFGSPKSQQSEAKLRPRQVLPWWVQVLGRTGVGKSLGSVGGVVGECVFTGLVGIFGRAGGHDCTKPCFG
mmetsp:Transcript_7159/g.11392  ORF Transcript_7159/g.11392 Transcript_7159/m.11392 type:complete len:105 (+) Transcript_7159:3006-3320(+)